MSGFEGFPEQALDFYDGLEADNSKAYWTDHRQVYESAVRLPMLALLAALEGEFGSGKLFRPYRDVRFSKDKTPYKTAAGAVAGGCYVQLSAAGLLVGAGYWRTSTDQARRLRAAWRVGRLRSALPDLAIDLVEHVDADLAAVPALETLSEEQLLALLRNGRRSLVTLNGHEALVGL